jgi:uncharacterized protein (TIGR04255 family)
VHNWRRVGEGVEEGEKYPNYEYICEQFEHELKSFEEFVSKHGLGEFNPNQCEITYINHIDAGRGWERHGQLEEVVSILSSRYSQPFPLDLEASTLSMRYIIPDDEGKPIGRLHVSLQPAFRKSDDTPIFILTLTARGRPKEESRSGVTEFLDTGRKLIVLGFTAITTRKMHGIWRRKDA